MSGNYLHEISKVRVSYLQVFMLIGLMGTCSGSWVNGEMWLGVGTGLPELVHGLYLGRLMWEPTPVWLLRTHSREEKRRKEKERKQYN